ncbi:MAG: hypothetical protein KDN19_09350 [Verrucomicrobiae bacterium]|nr:hypothetical protein [Verrucomicrobiae bacterium]
MDDYLEKTIRAFKAKLEEAESEVIRIKKSINDMCAIGGAPPMYADAQLNPETRGEIGFANDDFYGKPLATCVKQILERNKASGGGAMSVEEIYQILLAGGYHFDGKEENRKTILRTAMRKNVDFHKLPNNNYGLRSWYPKIKGGGSDSAQDADEGETDNPATEENDVNLF